MSYLARPLLFALDAERAHGVALAFARFVSRSRFLTAIVGEAYRRQLDPRLRVWCFDTYFKNPIGLAAGLDKNGVAIPFWEALGFGFIEVGTVTPAFGQVGNPRPRVFRQLDGQAILNAMGFPNAGAIPLGQQLREARKYVRVPIGVNIGKAKATGLETAAMDYVATLPYVWDRADYITVNVSSPNTEGLRALQGAEKLTRLLGEVQAENTRLGLVSRGKPKPVALKIAPDLTDDELDAVADVALSCNIAAIIATNTVKVSRTLPHGPFTGGISGPPVTDRALVITRHLFRKLERKVPIIGVGGIGSGADIYARMRAGASLVQLYTALVYEGPGLVGRMLDELSHLLDQKEIDDITSIIGADA